MIRAPLIQRKPRGLAKSRLHEYPAPVNGWNTRDPLQALRETDAYILENWFPTQGKVSLRKGAGSYAQGSYGLGTLHTYRTPTGGKMFAAGGGGVFDVTAGGATPAPDIVWSSTPTVSAQITVLGGTYLFLANGNDAVKAYNGTSWISPAITGATLSDLDFVCLAVSRIWFLKKDSLSAYYLPAGAIAGALTEFPLGIAFPRGGSVKAMGVWTIDGGSGADDYTIFLSSEGEVAVYKGNDPSTVATWSKVGTYYIGDPVGKNPICKYGGDLLITTKQGLYPLSKAVQSADVNRSTILTDKVAPSLSAYIQNGGTLAGWRCVIYPEANMLLLNAPVGSGVYHQFVMNTQTGAWCLFKGWNISDLVVFKGVLYGLRDSLVAELNTGQSDFGAEIQAYGMTGYSRFGNKSQMKQLHILRPILQVSQPLGYSLGLDCDYALSGFAPPAPTAPAGVGGVWNSSSWNNATWGSSYTSSQVAQTVPAPLFVAGATRLKFSTKTTSVDWISNTAYVEDCFGGF